MPLIKVKVTAPDGTHSIDFTVDTDTKISQLKNQIANLINDKAMPWLPELQPHIKNGRDIHLMAIQLHGTPLKEDLSIGEYKNSSGVLSYRFEGMTHELTDKMIECLKKHSVATKLGKF